MKLCLLTSRNVDGPHFERFQGVSDSLLRLVKDSGLSPLSVNSKTELDSITFLNPHLVIFTGGESVGINRERDQFELSLLDWCLKKQVPILGICRGMQLIVRFFGGRIAPIEGHVRRNHKVAGNFSGIVNSYHELGIFSVPPGFKVEARAEDNSVEAILNPEKKCLGILWHPERPGCEIPISHLFSALGV